MMETVTVNAAALITVLRALNGPSHFIRELQLTRGLPGDDNPIDLLIAEVNAQVAAEGGRPWLTPTPQR
ncbi:hypothetical protein [Castellaniella sp. UC4442_H9]